jgi:hypothetical protein
MQSSRTGSGSHSVRIVAASIGTVWKVEHLLSGSPGGPQRRQSGRAASGHYYMRGTGVNKRKHDVIINGAGMQRLCFFGDGVTGDGVGSDIATGTCMRCAEPVLTS